MKGERADKLMVLHAAELLSEEARVLKESCAAKGEPWQCGDCRTLSCMKRGHDDMVATAKELKRIARTNFSK